MGIHARLRLGSLACHIGTPHGTDQWHALFHVAVVFCFVAAIGSQLQRQEMGGTAGDWRRILLSVAHRRHNAHHASLYHGVFIFCGRDDGAARLHSCHGGVGGGGVDGDVAPNGFYQADFKCRSLR